MRLFMGGAMTATAQRSDWRLRRPSAPCACSAALSSLQHPAQQPSRCELDPAKRWLLVRRFVTENERASLVCTRGSNQEAQ